MFQNQLSSIKVTLLGMGLLCLLIGCQPTPEAATTGTTAAEAIATRQATSPPVTSPTATRSIIQPVRPTVMLTLSSTTLPPSQSTPTTLLPEAATSTPWPTVPPDEAADKVLSLLRDNQNPDCLLPCWWGTTPGQTHWQDVVPFLSTLAKRIIYISSETAEVVLPLPESVAEINSSTYRTFYSWNKSGIIEEIYVDAVNIAGYDAKTMLTLYGVPDEVWLSTFSENLPGEVLPFQLVIIYQQRGVSFRYYMNAAGTGETVTACFEPGVVELERPDLFPVSPRMYVWEPGRNKTIDEVANIPREIYLRLEDTTDLTPETLYEKFTNPDEQPCIDTPADFWGF